ncbi:MAG TPA: hypothetical protein VN229_14530 [Terriglobales bacterium]|nr:hypothetical protein [Terriglobales bacterium]
MMRPSVLCRYAVIIGLSVALCAMEIAPASADDFERATDDQAADVIPAALLSGPHFKVHPVVHTIGYFHQWVIETDYGNYTVIGDSALRKLVPEIYAITNLQDISRGEAFATAVASAAKSPFEFGYDLITSPVDTVSSLPSGVFRIFENAGEAIGAPKGSTEDSMVKQALIVSSWKRDYAAEAGIDVYSSNEALQKELNRIGWAAAIGGLSVSAVTMSVSGPAAAAFGNVRLAKSISDVLQQEPPARLRIINRDKLRAIHIADDLIERFLDKTVFTPRAQTIITASLADLGTEVAGRDTFLTQALSAEDEAEATFYVNAAQMLAGYHRQVSDMTRIVAVGRLVMATSRKGHAFVPAPVDRVFWTQQTWQVEGKMMSTAAKLGHDNKVDLWITGTASPMAKTESAKLGIAVTENAGDKLGVAY